MTAKQEAKLNMYHAVITHCDNNAAIVATVPAFDATMTTFKAKVSSLDATIQLEAQVITGVATDKQSMRDALCQQAADIAAVVFAYATNTANNELAESVDFSKSDLERLRDDQLPGVCNNIHAAANGNLVALGPYGITALMLGSFNTLITNYTSKVPAPRNAVALRKTYAANIKTFFKDADLLLKKILDKLAVQFKAANLEFYNTYLNNRIILDAATSKTKAAGTITNSADDTAIAGVTVATIVAGNPVSTQTDAFGKYKLPLPPGTYTITFTKTGFNNHQVTNVTITLGQTTTVDVEMTAV
jgi:hypothetical protein